VIVADTNVVSELMRVEPSPAVRAWVLGQGHHELRIITAITVAEILYRIERPPSGRRKATLRQAAVDVFSQFTEDVLPFDAATATIYPEIVDHRDRQGSQISGYDAQIAAICRDHDASLATRNEKEFAGVGIELIDPWSSV
jgi:predicted nucleic acid-binding protein